MANKSIIIHYSIVKQLVGLITVVLVFLYIFNDFVLAFLISIACYYFIAFFYVISFKITNEEFIVTYPYRFIFRRLSFGIDSIRSLDIYRKTGGRFSSPVIKISYMDSEKLREKTISFLMPSKKDFSSLVESLKNLVAQFKYHGHSDY